MGTVFCGNTSTRVVLPVHVYGVCIMCIALNMLNMLNMLKDLYKLTGNININSPVKFGNNVQY